MDNLARGAVAVAALLLLGLPAPGSAQSGAPPALGWESAGTCYEVFVRSFYDSDGDGVGDLRGLIRKLDYLNDGDPASTGDLGVDCVWLMPIAASPSY
ncbi:MAG TPA: alpha-amylase family glycosyl hydrolase, partial [Longimicrobiales bacterium]|nr:alpha-amylase family glycosyl hydrolase [Longimicrobiales bacterium]